MVRAANIAGLAFKMGPSLTSIMSCRAAKAAKLLLTIDLFATWQSRRGRRDGI